MSTATYAGVEMGGTKCICILGTGPDDIREQEIVQTGDPASTLSSIADVLERWSVATGDLEAIGVASFGPLDLRRDSRTYGRIGATPKERWKDVDLAGFFNKRFGVPVGFTTDVIGAALAEGRWGGAQRLTDFAYVTVGTGVGVGMVVAGSPVLGCHHPELGHVRVVRAAGDHWPGNCRFHGDCVEGLASGPAIEARSGGLAMHLPPDSRIWDTVAHALAQLAHILVVSVAPQRILMGGGVLNAQPHLFPRIRAYLRASLNGYLDIPEVTSGLDGYLVPPGLGTRAGPLGALALAADTAALRASASAKKPARYV
ncbi:MAG TPA: ROK family protein [Steroidobacteraceae bacterium]|jgi:fructokinase